MLPICYESGLPQGHSPEAPTFMNIATENYIKEMLTNIFSRVSSNGPNYIKTSKFKKECEREERKVERGEMTRTAGGLLPCEAEEMRKRRVVCMEDLRLCNEIGDSYLGQTPIIEGEIVNGRFLDAPGVEELEYESPSKKKEARESRVNGVGVGGGRPNGTGEQEDTVMTNGYGYHVELDEPVDEVVQWAGGGVQDLAALDSVLDSCLAVGT